MSSFAKSSSLGVFQILILPLGGDLAANCREALMAFDVVTSANLQASGGDSFIAKQDPFLGAPCNFEQYRVIPKPRENWILRSDSHRMRESRRSHHVGIKGLKRSLPQKRRRNGSR